MPKSRNRKNHKKKVQARNIRVESQRKKAMEEMETLRDQYASEMAKKAKEGSSADSGDGDGGDVPFTLDSK